MEWDYLGANYPSSPSFVAENSLQELLLYTDSQCPKQYESYSNTQDNVVTKNLAQVSFG